MKSIKHRLLSLLLTLVTILSLLPTAAFAASNTGSGLKITTNQAYWSTRLLANGTPYSYRPPLVDGKLVYCMDSGLGYYHLLGQWKTEYAPKREDGQWHPLFVEALQKQDYIGYLLDVLLSGTMEEKAAIVAEQGKEVMRIEQRISEFAAIHPAGRHERSGLARTGTDCR